jgi:hypothetical protein
MRFADLYDYKLISSRQISSVEHVSDIIRASDFEVSTTLDKQNSFVLGNYSRSIESLLSLEVSKYACAALESYFKIVADPLSNKSTGWALIKAYYSAFFAAHASLRTIGIIVSRLDKSVCEIIHKDAIRFYPGSLKPFTSTYKISYVEAARVMQFQQIDAEGGYHESFWNVYYQFIEAGLNSPKKHETVYQDELVLINHLKNNISKSPKYSWLSVIRNRINYQLPSDFWFPYNSDKKSIFYTFILSEIGQKKQILKDYKNLESKEEYYRFVATCDTIINLMIYIVDEFFIRNSSKNNIHKNTYYKLSRQYSKRYGNN